MLANIHNSIVIDCNPRRLNSQKCSVRLKSSIKRSMKVKLVRFRGFTCQLRQPQHAHTHYSRFRKKIPVDAQYMTGSLGPSEIKHIKTSLLRFEDLN